MPLILSRAPAPTTYKRNYLIRDEATRGPDGFDIITELVFPDRAAYQTWVSIMYAPGSGVPRTKRHSSTGPGRDLT